MYLGGEEILSNEYEDEPDLGSSSGPRIPLSFRESNVSSRVRPAAAVAESVAFAALQQELRVLRAQVATVAQTAFDIKSNLAKLSDRVVALEKQAYVASSTSSSHRYLMTRVTGKTSVARHKMSDGGACWTVCPKYTRCHAVQAP
ncbi:hypothetical protein L916_17588 [Phytophthora nicotianae]|uniref:Uncharacterized protein n=1 Tax=Phytophthora nicotianae TaxID=4792 RepID=W2I4Y4_PHYNI|nr:hypothetical protein L916_17588 [Phytophthora nicotianae]